MSCLPFSQQFVRGYMEIFGKDCHLVVRNETAALFDAQDGQVAALHAQELEPACKGGLGEPPTGAELSYFRTYDVFGSTIPVDLHRCPPSKDEVYELILPKWRDNILLKMKYRKIETE